MQTVTIAGSKFDLTPVYSAGHVLTEIEAKVLNQTRFENIRNNMASLVKEETAKGTDPAKIAKAVADYEASYTFTSGRVAGAGTRQLDPIERIARRIAKENIRIYLASQGRKLSTVPAGLTEDQWKEKLEAKIEAMAQREDVLAAAREEHKALEKLKAKRAPVEFEPEF